MAKKVDVAIQQEDGIVDRYRYKKIMRKIGKKERTARNNHFSIVPIRNYSVL